MRKGCRITEETLGIWGVDNMEKLVNLGPDLKDFTFWLRNFVLCSRNIIQEIVELLKQE